MFIGRHMLRCSERYSIFTWENVSVCVCRCDCPKTRITKHPIPPQNSNTKSQKPFNVWACAIRVPVQCAYTSMCTASYELINNHLRLNAWPKASWCAVCMYVQVIIHTRSMRYSNIVNKQYTAGYSELVPNDGGLRDDGTNFIPSWYFSYYINIRTSIASTFNSKSFWIFYFCFCFFIRSGWFGIFHRLICLLSFPFFENDFLCSPCTFLLYISRHDCWFALPHFLSKTLQEFQRDTWCRMNVPSNEPH